MESPICYMEFMIAEKVSPLCLVANVEQQRDKEPNAFLKLNRWQYEAYLESIVAFAALTWMLQF